MAKRTNNGNTVAAYIRVSTAGQNLASQRKGIRDWLKRNNITESSVRWYQDKKSGRTIDRSNLRKMMRAVEQGKISTVVCYSLNRMARSLHHGVNLLQELCDKNVRVVSVTEQLDFSGIVGKIIAAVMFGLAQAEVEGRRAAIKDGMEVARAIGKHIGRPRDTKRLSKIRKMFDSGVPAVEIARRLRCTRSNIYAALSKTT